MGIVEVVNQELDKIDMPTGEENILILMDKKGEVVLGKNQKQQLLMAQEISKHLFGVEKDFYTLPSLQTTYNMAHLISRGTKKDSGKTYELAGHKLNVHDLLIKLIKNREPCYDPCGRGCLVHNRETFIRTKEGTRLMPFPKVVPVDEELRYVLDKTQFKYIIVNGETVHYPIQSKELIPIELIIDREFAGENVFAHDSTKPNVFATLITADFMEKLQYEVFGGDMEFHHNESSVYSGWTDPKTTRSRFGSQDPRFFGYGDNPSICFRTIIVLEKIPYS